MAYRVKFSQSAVADANAADDRTSEVKLQNTRWECNLPNRQILTSISLIAKNFYSIRRNGMSEIWKKAEKLNGTTLYTIARKKPFDILDVTSGNIVFTPQIGNGSRRSIPLRNIEYVNGLGLSEDEITPIRMKQVWPNSQNSSYIAAIARELMKQ